MAASRLSEAPGGIEPATNGAPGEPSERVRESDGASQRHRPALRIAGFAALAIVALAVVLWGVRFLAYATTHESTDDAKIDADAIVVTSKIAERVDNVLVDTNQYVHRGQVLIALDAVDERNALLAARAARDAQLAQARAAQANVALAADQQRAQAQQGAGAIAQAQAGIQNASEQALSAQQQTGVAQSGVSLALAQLQVARAGVPAAREAWNRARADLARTTALLAQGAVPRAQLDSARAAEAQARASYRQATDQVVAAQANVASAQQRVTAERAAASGVTSAIGAAQGALTSAQGKLAETDTPYKIAAQQATAQAAFAQIATLNAQVRNAEERLKNTRLVAPVDGYVGAKNIEIGRTVSPGESLLTIVPNKNLYVTANFKETQIGKMKPGQHVDLKVDAYKGTPFSGHVQALGPASESTYSLIPAQNASGNFVKVTQRIPVRIVIETSIADKPLRPGMSVEASVKVK